LKAPIAVPSRPETIDSLVVLETEPFVDATSFSAPTRGWCFMGNDTIVGLGKPVGETVNFGVSRATVIRGRIQPVEFEKIGKPRFFGSVPISFGMPNRRRLLKNRSEPNSFVRIQFRNAFVFSVDPFVREAKAVLRCGLGRCALFNRGQMHQDIDCNDERRFGG